MSESQALVNIQEQMKKELENQANTAPPPTTSKISTKGKIFTLPNGRTSRGPMQVVILDHRNFNAYYPGAYNPNKPVPPVCFAIAKEAAALAPPEEAPDPQNPKCNGCPQNDWGSAPGGGRGKACKNAVRLAVVAPDADKDDDPALLTLSPTSLKGWGALLSTLETSGMLPIQVVVDVSFDPNQTYPVLQFEIQKPHDNVEHFWQYREKAAALLDEPPVMD